MKEDRGEGRPDRGGVGQLGSPPPPTPALGPASLWCPDCWLQCLYTGR